MPQYLLAIDQGTTSSRAIIFSREGDVMAQHQIELMQYYPFNGWVEQDPEAMWENTLECCHQVLQAAKLSAKKIAAIGITNQRETTLVWNKQTGKVIYPAIVWQDRRTAEKCQKLATHISSEKLQAKTGLLLDSYFSASKIAWLLDNVADARQQAEQGLLAFGTVDTFLLWRLTKGNVHATDATNASRTLLFNIHTQTWDEELLHLFNIPACMLPIVLDSSAQFGVVDPEFFGERILIGGIAGDQQAAAVGQACFASGLVKSTLGTGCFMFLNTGRNPVISKNKLLTTIAYRLNGEVTYGLEGSIFSAGSTVKWLRDKLGFIKSAAETEALAQSISDTNGIYLIPAFTGLGAPYWQPDARAVISGLTRNSSIAEIVRAALEAVAYQSRDLLLAMTADSGVVLTELRVDGGMVANNWLLQFLADILALKIQRPHCIETTALGAAYLAGLQAGLYESLDEIASLRCIDRDFSSVMPLEKRAVLYSGWLDAIRAVINMNKSC